MKSYEPSNINIRIGHLIGGEFAITLDSSNETLAPDDHEVKDFDTEEEKNAYLESNNLTLKNDEI